jgi:molecular chaperone IbpA
MRTPYDFAPLFRSSVGFDRVFDLLENAARVQAIDNWPPYNIERAGEDQYRITMAVAGFTPDELDLTAQPNLLVVSGQKKADGNGQQYLSSTCTAALPPARSSAGSSSPTTSR